MNRNFISPPPWGYCVIFIAFLFISCQKSNDFSQKQNSIAAKEESNASAKDVYTYYYSAAEKKLFVAETYKSLCMAELDAREISNEKWIIGFPSKAGKPEAQVILMKSGSFSYVAKPNPGDIRNRPGFNCLGSVAASETCENVAGNRSVKVSNLAYRYCVYTGVITNFCVEVYSVIKTGTSYSQPNCMGTEIGNVKSKYGWTCL